VGAGSANRCGLSLDLPAEVEIAAMLVVKPSARLLAASSDGRGFLTSGEAVLAETRKGKQLMNLRAAPSCKVLRPVPEGRKAVAVIGDNRKLLVFNLSELPEMGRGSGVQLQRYRDGGLADVAMLKAGEGLSWSMGGDSGRTRSESDLTPWRAIRGASGRMAPLGFPRSNRFQGD
jgi:topoisomerase-4 subunit A